MQSKSQKLSILFIVIPPDFAFAVILFALSTLIFPEDTDIFASPTLPAVIFPELAFNIQVSISPVFIFPEVVFIVNSVAFPTLILPDFAVIFPIVHVST